MRSLITALIVIAMAIGLATTAPPHKYLSSEPSLTSNTTTATTAATAISRLFSRSAMLPWIWSPQNSNTKRGYVPNRCRLFPWRWTRFNTIPQNTTTTTAPPELPSNVLIPPNIQPPDNTTACKDLPKPYRPHPPPYALSECMEKSQRLDDPCWQYWLEQLWCFAMDQSEHPGPVELPLPSPPSNITIRVNAKREPADVVGPRPHLPHLDSSITWDYMSPSGQVEEVEEAEEVEKIEETEEVEEVEEIEEIEEVSMPTSYPILP
ncbi:unnamed protein product [Periconia digitata]|uniref:Uncharacterized protein n=1 Tax=Periconia digitata TaxID=1303443 RepID=A0A9W4XIM8_9PLEO|nr:unnamed protein product [Periconia digitata]